LNCFFRPMNTPYNFLPPFLIGIKEAFNPYALATVLLFLVFLCRSGKSRREIFLMGVFFISSALATTLLLSFGIFDSLFKHAFIVILSRIFYLVIAVIFLLVGNSLFRGWRQCKLQKNQEKDCSPLWPCLFKKEETLDKKRISCIMVGAIVLGFLLTFFSSIWPQDYYMFLMFFYWVSRSDSLLAGLSFIWYSIGFVFPLFIVWLAVWMLISSQWLNNFLVRAVPCVKIIISSVYFSMAISLIYLSIK